MHELSINTATQQARQNVKISFILSEVARAESLSVADAQVQMTLAQMAARSGEPVKKFLAKAEKNGVISSLRDDLLLQNAIEFLKDQAIVEETEPEERVGATESTVLYATVSAVLAELLFPDVS